VKHRFLLDVVILYHAVRGVDQYENPDLTAATLISLIGKNCHTVVADKVLAGKYDPHLRRLWGKPSLQYGASFITELRYNSSKFFIEGADPPELPTGVKVPREDEYVVRAALISQPLVVTAEKKLLKAINTQPTLGLRAVSPSEALELAKEK
jgi:hypothetical protein